MELTAIIKGLEALSRPCEVEVYTDSRYAVDAINKGWLKSWQSNGWRKAARKGRGQPVLNQDLWEQLLAQLENHTVRFNWVRGHSGHVENERADQLAVSGIPL